MDTLTHSPRTTAPECAPSSPFPPLHLAQVLGRDVIPGEVLIFPYWKEGAFAPLQTYRTASPLTVCAYLSTLGEAPPGAKRWDTLESGALPIATRSELTRDQHSVNPWPNAPDMPALREKLRGRHLGVYVTSGGMNEACRMASHLARLTRAHLPAHLLSWLVITGEGCAWGESARESYAWPPDQNPYGALAVWEGKNSGRMIAGRQVGEPGWMACQLYFPSRVEYLGVECSQQGARGESETSSEEIALIERLFARIDVFAGQAHSGAGVDSLSRREWESLWPWNRFARELAESFEGVHQRDRLLVGALCGREFSLETPPEQMGAYLGEVATSHVDLMRTHVVIALCDALAGAMPEHAATVRSISAYLCWWLGNMPGAAARLSQIGKPGPRYRLARLVRLSVERNFFSPYVLAPSGKE